MSRSFYEHQVSEITVDDIKEWLTNYTVGLWEDTKEPVIKPIALATLNYIETLEKELKNES